jgi:hypothetical protein
MKMHKVVGSFVLALCTAVPAFAQYGSAAVSTNSVIVVPSSGLIKSVLPAATATVTVVAGTYYRSLGSIYLATSSGAVTTAPSHASGDATHDGITWRKARDRDRHGLVISNGSTTLLHAVFGYPAAAGSGIRLQAGSAPVVIQDNMPVHVSCISDTPGGVLSWMEW